MIAPADWLDVNKDRPPVPRRVKAEPYVGKHRAPGWDDDVDFVPSPVPRGCAPAWPDVDEDAPTVGFDVVKPSRFSREWWRGVLSLPRLVAAGSSAVVLLVTGLGWIQ